MLLAVARLLFLLRIVVANAAFGRDFILLMTIDADFHPDHVFLNLFVYVNQFLMTVYAFVWIVLHFMMSGREFDVRTRGRRPVLGMTVDAISVGDPVPRLDYGRSENGTHDYIPEESYLAAELADDARAVMARHAVYVGVRRFGPGVVVRFHDMTRTAERITACPYPRRRYC